jgi:hypothetical protein
MKCFRMTGAESKTYALPEFFDKGNRLRCDSCGCLLDPFYRTLKLNFSSKRDVLVTYDGILIVSKRFKDFTVQSGWGEEIIFYPINEDGHFFYFTVPNNIVKIDKIKTGITFRENCVKCGYPSEIFGGEKIFLKDSDVLLEGFYRSDLFWRTHYIFRPAIFVGINTAQMLKEQKFSGLDLYRKIF